MRKKERGRKKNNKGKKVVMGREKERARDVKCNITRDVTSDASSAKRER